MTNLFGFIAHGAPDDLAPVETEAAREHFIAIYVAEPGGRELFVVFNGANQPAAERFAARIEREADRRHLRTERALLPPKTPVQPPAAR